MRLGTSTGLFSPRPDSQPQKLLLSQLEQCVEAGFRVIDVSFCNAVRPAKKDEIADPDWERYVDALGRRGEELGVDFSQCHLPYNPDLFMYGRQPDEDYVAMFRAMTERSIIAAGRLGVKWAVAHPLTDNVHAEWDNAVNRQTNLDFYAPFVELAEKHHVGIALENMAEFSLEKARRRYCCSPEELIDLVDAFASPSVGICWDFGHANSVLRDQPAALRRVGSRLKATHVQDNRTNVDSHLTPFIGGNMKWESIMPTLVEIGYAGDFVYEAHRFMQNMPDALRPAAAAFAYALGEYCLSLAK